MNILIVGGVVVGLAALAATAAVVGYFILNRRDRGEGPDD